MTATVPDSDRRLLPSLRSSGTIATSGDLLSVTPKRVVPSTEISTPHFDELYSGWQKSPTIDVAAELLATGIVLGRLDSTAQVAKFITQHHQQVTQKILGIARSVLEPPEGPELSTKLPDRAEIRTRLKIAKEYLRENPKNAIVWMDRAQLHASIGQREVAERAVRNALILAPENRFVLRTAARFYAHIDQKERGIEVLRGADLLRNDPWIMSAEIALSDAAGDIPISLKRALSVAVSDHLDPWHTGELNGALATFAIHDRSVGKPGKFFRQSMRKPTDNAIAQAQWFANLNNSFNVSTELIQKSHAYEAMALRARAERRWMDVLNACRNWSIVEPTSTRPLSMAGFLACVALNDGRKALQFTNRWIELAPDSAEALNNHVVALTYAGELNIAERLFLRINQHSKDFNQTVNLATGGLLAYRKGDRAGGQKFYSDAMSTRGSQDSPNLRALVMWHWLREEARCVPSDFEQALETASKNAKLLDLPEISTMRETILDDYRQHRKKGRREIDVLLPNTLSKFEL